MVRLELSDTEAKDLERVLSRHLEEMLSEVAHTESIELQRELKKDLDRIEALQKRVASAAHA